MRVYSGIFATFLFVLTLSCDGRFDIEKVHVDNGNALRVPIHFHTTGIVSTQIEYWIENDSMTFFTERNQPGKDHSFTLQSLVEKSNYKFRIHSKRGEENYTSESYSFSTISLPISLPSFELEIEFDGAFQGLILVKKVQYPGQHLLIDQKGEIRWYEEFDSDLYRPFSWTTKGHVLSMISDHKFQEFDLDGKLKFSMEKGQGDLIKLIHHEIIKDRNNNYVTLTRNNKVFDLSEIGGLPNDTIKGDGIIVLNDSGEKVWEWDIFSFSDPLASENILKKKNDWSHANSINLDIDGNYLVSFRHFNQIWKIDSKSGDVIWKIGKDGDFLLNKNELFYLQHAAHINSRGELMLFDNGRSNRKISRALSFKIDEKKLKAEMIINISLPDSLFSFKQGSAYLIEDDKVLFCSSIKYRVVMTNLSGAVLWQLKSSHSFYRAEYIDCPESFHY